jgi:hypothetical protein
VGTESHYSIFLNSQCVGSLFLCCRHVTCRLYYCQQHTDTPTYAMPMFRMIWRKSNFVQVGAESTTYIHTYVHIHICTYIHTYLHMYIHTRRSRLNLILTKWNLSGRSMTSHCLCYCKAVLFCHLQLITLSFLQG